MNRDVPLHKHLKVTKGIQIRKEKTDSAVGHPPCQETPGLEEPGRLWWGYRWLGRTREDIKVQAMEPC